MAKRSTLIGINYIGKSHELRGCHNDVENVRMELLGNGFDNEHMKVMLDSRGGRGKTEPNRKNIIETLKLFVKNAKAGDLLYVHYSGHGTYTRDRKNSQGVYDEKDGRDEAICPSDDTIILDDELFEILVLGLPTGVKLRVVMDCCHSGSALDLPCRYLYGSQFFTENRHIRNKDIMMISGCRDDQTSADAWEDGDFTGALTWAFLKAMNFAQKYFPKMSWKDLLMEIRRNLIKKGYKQVPQLSMSSKNLLNNPVDLF